MQASAIVNGDKIELSFPYDLRVLAEVRAIEGRAWNEPSHPNVWTLPFTGWHCQQVIQKFPDWYIDSAITFAAQGASEKPTKQIKLPKELYQFQREGVEYIASTKGRCIIADDMGLGKSAEALVYLRFYSTGRTLIVAPSNVTYKWRDEECRKWWPEKSVEVVRTGKEKIPDVDILIMSYGIMVSKLEMLKMLNIQNIILDEAHYVKGVKAQRTRAAKSLINSGVPRVLLVSGTPFLNNPGELFTLLNMLDPKGFNNYFSYAVRYCGAYKQEGIWVFPKDVVTNREELEKRLQRYLIRRTKNAVELQLPDLTRSYLPIELSAKKEYMDEVSRFKEWRKEHKKANPLAQLTALRQLLGNLKVEPTVELAESILEAGRKVVIFAHHKETVARLIKALFAYGVGVISGDVQDKDRQKQAKDFLLDTSKLRVMIITVAGAEGINLFSASDIIFCEREWTPAKEEQAEARLHRIGQKSAVTSYYLVVKDTIDEKMDRLVRLKREVIGQVISQDEIVEEILETLKGV